jgi:hypothetical protein
VPDLIRFCKKHKLVMITVSELARYRMDLDDGAVLEALEGFIPVCPRLSAPGARRFEPGDLITSHSQQLAPLNPRISEMSTFENLRKR